MCVGGGGGGGEETKGYRDPKFKIRPGKGILVMSH